jgi:transcriptional regulator with XRE-family HTH domain
MDDQRVGAALRAIRRRRGLRQLDVARLAGVDQTTISRIERGRLDSLAVRTLRAVFAVLDARYESGIWWRAGDLDRLLDERHAALCSATAAAISRRGWDVHPEVSFSIYGERGSIDILAYRQSDRALLVGEIKSELVSIEETLRRLDVKRRLASQIARDRLGVAPALVGCVLVLPERGSSRAAIARHEAVMRAALPDRAAHVHAWLARPSMSLSAIWFLSDRSGRPATRTPAGAHRVRVPRARPSAPG